MLICRNGAPVFYDEGADLVVGLRVGRALAANDEGALGSLEHVERARHRTGAGIWAGAASITFTTSRAGSPRPSPDRKVLRAGRE